MIFIYVVLCVRVCLCECVRECVKNEVPPRLQLCLYHGPLKSLEITFQRLTKIK